MASRSSSKRAGSAAPAAAAPLNPGAAIGGLIEGDVATEALGCHMQEIKGERDEYQRQIEELEEQKRKLQQDLDQARERMDNLKEGQVDADIQEAQEKFDADLAQEREYIAEIAGYDKELGTYKDQLAKLFEDMHKKSTEMNKHCKSKDEDKKHIDAVADGLAGLEEQVNMGKEIAAKRQARVEAQANLDVTKTSIKDGKARIEMLIQQKADEMQEAQDIQIKFAQIDAEMNDLDGQLEILRAQKADIDAVIEETEKAFGHIMDSSATLLQCMKREAVILQNAYLPDDSKPKAKPKAKRR